MKWKSYLQRTCSATFARWRTLSRVGLCSASLLCLAGNAKASLEDDVRFIRNYQQGIAVDVDSIQNSVQVIQALLRVLGAGQSVTNFLGVDEWEDFRGDLAGTFMQAIQDAGPAWIEAWASFYRGPVVNVYESLYPEFAFTTYPVAMDGSPVYQTDHISETSAVLLYDFIPALVPYLSALGSSNAAISTAISTASATNAVNLESLREELSSIGETIDETPDETSMDYANEGQTYSNAVPVAALSFGNVEVETSPLEQSIGGLEGSLEGMAIQTSTQVPVILIKGGTDRIEAPLDLSDLRAVTAICRVLWRVLLFVGVLGVVRSEWDYWTTLGGSAT